MASQKNEAPLNSSTALHSQNRDGQLVVLQATTRLARLLNNASGIEAAVYSLMKEFVDIANADEGSIQLLRPSSETTRFTLIRQDGKIKSILDKRLDDFLTGWILKQNRSLQTNELAPLLEMDKMPQRYSNIGSLLAVPLVAAGGTIGAVNLVRLKENEPFSSADHLLVSSLAEQIGDFIEGASVRQRLYRQNEMLRKNLGNRFSVHGILGQSPAIKQVFRLLDQVIPTDARVVLHGESGTGKELIAKCIHFAGPRKEKPFIAIDCGALPANLLESELFGYVRGAFTGATRDRAGLIKEADGGTLFLDEITNMNTETQVKLLRVIQEEELRPLGSNKLEKVDVRIIVAASSNLAELVSSGAFRPDLYFRLNVVSIQIPPLRDRIEDIPVLANLFLENCAKKHGKVVHTIAGETMQLLEGYNWPGNIRELENIIERAVVMTHYQDKVLLPEHLEIDSAMSNAQAVFGALPQVSDLTVLLAEFERDLIKRVLAHHNWNQTAAAKALNISEAVVRYKMKRLDLVKPS